MSRQCQKVVGLTINHFEKKIRRHMAGLGIWDIFIREPGLSPMHPRYHHFHLLSHERLVSVSSFLIVVLCDTCNWSADRFVAVTAHRRRDLFVYQHFTSHPQPWSRTSKKSITLQRTRELSNETNLFQQLVTICFWH